MTTPQLHADSILMTVAIILGLGSILGYVSKKIHVPDIVLYLIAGIIIGPQVAGVINIPATSSFSWVILIFGASYILFDGGAMLSLSVLGKMWLTLLLIVTVGVAITALIAGLAAWVVISIPLMGALLLGAAIASTDPAALVAVFKKLSIKKRVSDFVVGESGFNDPVGTILTLAFLAIVMATSGSGHTPTLLQDAESLLWHVALGIAVGIVLGYVTSLLIAHQRFGILAEYLPIITIIVVIGSYLTAKAGFGASGFMGVFVAGLVVGNMKTFGISMPRKNKLSLDEFVETTSTMARMFLFFLLGSQVQLHLIAAYWWQGLVVVAVLMFIARPLVVFLCALPDRKAKWSKNELLFLSWTRETGVIPGTLASILVAENAPNAEVIAAVIFIVIVVTIMLQATTAKWAAKRLGLLEREV